MQITISDSARSKLSELVAAKGTGHTVRIGLRSGGCKGFEQFIDLMGLESPGDTRIDLEGLSILIDKKSQIFLAGSTFDWKTSLTESRFVFTFPDKKQECSCGKSFSI